MSSLLDLLKLSLDFSSIDNADYVIVGSTVKFAY